MWIVAVVIAAAIAPTTVRADSKNEIRAVTFEDDAGTTRVHVRGAQTPTFTVYKLERPSRVVIDVPQAQLAEALRGHETASVLAANTWAVSTIAAQQLDDGGQLVRVIVTLARPGRYDVKTTGNELIVMVMPRDAAPRTTSPEALAAAQAEREQAKQAALAAEQGRAQAEQSTVQARAEAAKAKDAAATAQAEAAKAKDAAATAQADAERLRKTAADQAARAQAAQQAADQARRAGAQASAADLERARTLASQAQAEAAQSKIDAAVAQREADRARLAAEQAAQSAQAEAGRARSQLAQAQAEAAKTKQDAARELQAAARTRSEAEAAKQAASRDVEAAARTRSEAEAAKQAASRDVEAAAREAAAAKQDVARSKAEADAARADAARTKALAEATQAAAQQQEGAATRAKAEADAARREAEVARNEAARTRAQAIAAKEDVARTKAEAQAARSEADKASALARASLAETQAAKADAAHNQAEAVAARRQAEVAEREVVQKNAEAVAAQADAARMKDLNARMTADAGRARREAEAARADATQQRAMAEAARHEAETAKLAAAADKRQAEAARGDAEKLMQKAQQQVAALDKQAQSAQAVADKARAANAAAEAREQSARQLVAQAASERQAAEAAAKLAADARDRKAHQAGADRDRAIADAQAAEARLATARKATDAAEHQRADADALAATAKRDLEHTRGALAAVEQQRTAAEAAATDAARKRGEAEAAASDAARRRSEAEIAATDAAKQRTAAEQATAQATQRAKDAQRAAEQQELARAKSEQAAAQAATRLAAAQAARPITPPAAAPGPRPARSATASLAAAIDGLDGDAGDAPSAPVILVANKTKSAAPAAPAPVPPAAVAVADTDKPAKPKGPVAHVRDVAFTGDDVTGHVAIALDGNATVAVGLVTPTTAELVIDHAEIGDKLERKLDVSKFGGPVRAVSSFRDRRVPGRVRLIAELSSPATPSFDRDAGGIRWNFVGADIAKRPVTTRPAVATQPAPAPVGGFGAASTPVTQQSVAQLPPQGSRRRVYHGQTVELHFKDAPIHDLLRIIADTGKVSIVVPDTVDAKVTLDLKRVPWDQALEVILSSHQLWYRREGNLYRIAPRKELDAEDEAEAARREAQLKSESPRPGLVPLNYASASDLAKKLEPMLSPHGKIAVDERTNQLIVTDVAGNREQISRLAQSLDTQTPQISIEARIVEANSTFLRQIGVQWGGRALAGATSGNATGLVWPSSISLIGGNEDATTNRTGIATPSDFAVNLPAATGSGEGGALGLSLGSVGGNFNINLRLSALEDAGTVRIISAPKITVLNNKQASIASGVSIPISTISATGTQTQFVQADLRLDVTPTVSQRDCAIAMNLSVTKNAPDFGQLGARGDPTIQRKEAHTSMIVSDGQTSVLGGIYTRNAALAYKKIPLLGDIPVLGWLFKNRREQDDRTEILVFITPRITNRALLSCK
jgi:type IV pilus assembly protein PilQ